MGKLQTTAQLVSDAEIERVHANVNFGATPKRQVVEEALESTFAGFHTGYTARCILIEHGLAANWRNARLVPRVTKKGLEYLRAMTRERMLAKYQPQSPTQKAPT